MLKKEDIMECIELFFVKVKQATADWDDYSKQHIRLKSANEKRLEDSKQQHINLIHAKKRERYLNYHNRLTEQATNNTGATDGTERENDTETTPRE